MVGGQRHRPDGVVSYRASRPCIDKSLLPAQHPSPLTSRSWWCWWLVNSHVHMCCTYTTRGRRTIGSDNDAGPLRGLLVCGPGTGAEDQTVLLFSAPQAGRGDRCMVVVCGLQRSHRHGHPPGPAYNTYSEAAQEHMALGLPRLIQ